jgi:hypothetical protein
MRAATRAAALAPGMLGARRAAAQDGAISAPP